MTRSYRVANAVAAVALLVATSSASALVFTCETITQKGTLDPVGAPFAGKFGLNRRGGPAINGSGDVTFFATPRGGPRRLYLYPAVGAPSVLAEQGAPAPGGSSFTRFQMPSINDSGDIAFFGHLASGQGVFIKPAAGAMIAVARAGDGAPGGGTYDSFDGVSRINAAGDVAFLASVSGGPSGIFRYDSGTMTIGSEVRVGDVALDGREICSFVAPAVGLGATTTAFHVVTKVSCADAFEVDAIGIYRRAGLGIERVALEGDATPTPATTYAKFYGDPDVNASDQVLFRASAAGTPHFTGLFLLDPAGPATSTVVGTGDVAPGGGAYRTITEPSLTDGGRAGFRANVKSPAHEGIFLHDGLDERVVSRPDPVPNDVYTAEARYRKIFEEIGVDRSGTWVTYSATVNQPGVGTRLGLFRCEGS